MTCPFVFVVNFLRQRSIFAKNLISVQCRSLGHDVGDSSAAIKPTIKAVKLDAETLNLVCKLSLVDLSDETNVSLLESAIEFADQLFEVHVGDGVEPMYSVQEKSSLLLREDKVTVPDCRDQLLRCARKSEEEYFVAPSGNVPIKSTKF